MSSSQDSSASKLSDAVKEMKHAYWMYRRRWWRADHVGSDVEEMHWRKAAEELLKLSIPPRRYVRWAYRLLRTTNHTVWIPQVTASKMIQKFVKGEGMQSVELDTLMLQLQLKRLAQLVADKTLREIVEDELLDLCDAVRYAVARKYGMSDIAERLRSSAELDLLNEPVFSEVLAGFLQ